MSDPSAAPPPPPVWNAAPGGAPPVRYGGFWVRVAAYIVDSIVLTLAFVAVSKLTPLNLFDPDLKHFDPLDNGISLVAGLLYFALMESSPRGATLGKMAMGLRVVTEKGERLSFANATGRYFAKVLSALLLGIGFIMVAFSDRKRGLHDMIAGTLVVQVP